MINNFNMSKKMILVALATLLSLVFLGVFLLLNEKNTMINEKKSKLKNIVELSYSVVEAQYNAFKEGVIDEETAKLNAFNIVNKLRYNKVDYVWINDDKTPYPTMIMHPTAPSLNGKVLNSEKFNCAINFTPGDNEITVKTDGKKNLFQAFAEVANKSGTGFVTYLWTKPIAGGGTTKETYEKLSYVKKFDQWGWVLGTGIYIDDVNEQFYNNVFKASGVVVVILLILGILFLIIIKDIVTKIESFKDGLYSFFAYLNRESLNITTININSQDEFGQMAKVVNQNIQKTQKNVEEDRQVIDDTIEVLSEFEQGDLCQRVNTNSSNPALQELTTLLNKMGENMKTNIDNALTILEQYSNNNYINRVKTDGIKEHLLRLANGTNTLGDAITQMLLENKANGLTLGDSSAVLLKNVNTLNQNSNQAAAALEETAAALEEITSNIASNNNNIIQMAQLASGVTDEASKGEALANQTTQAMSEIDTEVNAISEAITVIDQIAFQTNILSLNAAVEAATAGEAGKGFAVVAQEVRNLASRSAEAANEIKQLVENATKKANGGKKISSDMIAGYKQLNENISKTVDLIKDVEMASKEQQQGIEQINDAVASLDQQTQQNAMIASQTHDVAVDTDTIAKLVVEDANSKNFIGKESVKAKDMKRSHTNTPSIQTPIKQNTSKNTTTKPTQKQTIKPVVSNTNDDEWASF